MDNTTSNRNKIVDTLVDNDDIDFEDDLQGKSIEKDIHMDSDNTSNARNT